MAFKKEGTIRIRPNGTVELRVYINGKQKSFYGKTENEARRAHRLFIQSQEKEEHNDEKSLISLSDYINNWLTTYKFGSVKNSTYDRLENVYNVHIKNSSIGQKKLSDISSDDIQDFINKKRMTLSISSIKKIKEILSPCFRRAVRNGEIKTNPMDLVVMPTNKTAIIDTKETDIYTDDEIEKIYHAALPIYFSNNAKRYRYAPMFVFILNTGLRIGECLALTWDDVNYEKKFINVNKSVSTFQNRGRYENESKKIQKVSTTKTVNGVRCVPLNDSAIESLKEMQKRNFMYNIHSNICFPSYKGKVMNIRSVQKTFESICADMGIEHKGLHALRHTFGSILVRNNTNIKIVSEILGHSDVKFTYNRYIHILNEQKAEAIELLDIASLFNTTNSKFLKEQGYIKGVNVYDLNKYSIYRGLNT
ncbi:MAG: tyrosine-type recombinase/integrase [Candidatus Gastranaerophilaceae bacterium]